MIGLWTTWLSGSDIISMSKQDERKKLAFRRTEAHPGHRFASSAYKAAKIAVLEVQAVYPGFRVEDDDEQGGGLIVKCGTPSVTRRKDAGAISGNQ